MKKCIISLILLFILLSMNVFSNGSTTNNFTLHIICTAVVFIPETQSKTPTPAIVADGITHDFTGNNVISFYLEGDGAMDYDITITRWDQSLVINGATYTMNVKWYVTDESRTDEHVIPVGTDLTTVNPKGEDCKSRAYITIIAESGSASPNSPPVPNGVPFVYMMSATAN